jgi:hypothetical protein
VSSAEGGFDFFASIHVLKNSMVPSVLFQKMIGPRKKRQKDASASFLSEEGTE